MPPRRDYATTPVWLAELCRHRREVAAAVLIALSLVWIGGQFVIGISVARHTETARP